MTSTPKQEIDEFLKKIFKIGEEFLANDIFKELSLPHVLYHYTDIYGLEGILRARSIRASHYKYMNDGKEIVYGDELITSVIEERLKNVSVDCEKQLLERLISSPNRETRSLLQHWEYDLYLACFSENGDLLDQWRAYANDGTGYAIGIRPYELKEKIPGYIVADETQLAFVKLEYDESKQKNLIIKIIDEIVSRLIDQLVGIENSELQFAYIFVTEHMLGEKLKDLTYFFKHPAFSNEQEWRVIRRKYPKRDGSDYDPLEGVQFRSARSLLIPYVEFNFLAQGPENLMPLDEILLGPKHKHDNSLESLKMYLLQLGYKDGSTMPNLRVSDIPYR